MELLAIDPGDVHVGWAYGTKLEDEGGWAIAIGEWTHADAPMEVSDRLNRINELIIEEYVLYPEKAAMQSRSPMSTSELIGKLKMLAEIAGVEVVMQGAYIKRPTWAQLRARGIDRLGQGKGGHAKDAFTHLWYRILKEGY